MKPRLLFNRFRVDSNHIGLTLSIHNGNEGVLVYAALVGGASPTITY